jgi:hypothetical protein
MLKRTIWNVHNLMRNNFPSNIYVPVWTPPTLINTSVGAMTFSVTTRSIMAFAIFALSIMSFSVMTLSLMPVTA